MQPTRRPASPAAEARAVAALRTVHSNPHAAARWAELDAQQHMAFVISHLLGLPSCCPAHERGSRQILREFLPAVIDPERAAIRRRAIELLTAVAIVDGHPSTAELAVGQSHEAS